MLRPPSLGLLLLLSLIGCARPGKHDAFVEPFSGIEFVRIPAGEFRMGSPENELGRENGELQHSVTLTRDFYLGVHEITQEQWRRVMGDNPSRFSDCGPQCPVERVNYHDAQRFIQKLNRRSALKFRLPTEAEWEYACRAGTTTPFPTGDTLTTDQANFHGGYPYGTSPQGVFRESPTPAGSFPPNAWGLFDMNGNVWEWTVDRHCPYKEERVTDPIGSCATELLVIRGGSWYFDGNSSRCALRYTHRPQDLGPSLGFRLAATLPQDPPFE